MTIVACDSHKQKSYRLHRPLKQCKKDKGACLMYITTHLRIFKEVVDKNIIKLQALGLVYS